MAEGVVFIKVAKVVLRSGTSISCCINKPTIMHNKPSMTQSIVIQTTMQQVYLEVALIRSLQQGFALRLALAAQDLGFAFLLWHWDPNRALEALTDVRRHLLNHYTHTSTPDLAFMIWELGMIITWRHSYAWEMLRWLKETRHELMWLTVGRLWHMVEDNGEGPSQEVSNQDDGSVYSDSVSGGSAYSGSVYSDDGSEEDTEAERLGRAIASWRPHRCKDEAGKEHSWKGRRG